MTQQEDLFEFVVNYFKNPNHAKTLGIPFNTMGTSDFTDAVWCANEFRQMGYKCELRKDWPISILYVELKDFA